MVVFVAAKSRSIRDGVLQDISLLSLEDVESILTPNIRLTFDYILLITAACVISTLGLLLNSTPVIVGGMIISPLMWPIVGSSYALWQSETDFFWRSMRLLAVSVLFTLATSALLTFLSPVKILNEEILSRTSPTLFDLVVAIASGAVAMLSLTNKRVSNTIAGVAIATALLPPVCVSGIGIALFNVSVFWGGLLLFFTNAVAIITVGMTYLTAVSVIRDRVLPAINIRGTVIFFLLLFLLAIPLKKTLSQYGWKLGSVQKTRTVMLAELDKIDSNITLASIQVNEQREDHSEIVLVDADIVVPQSISVTFDDKEQIRKELERSLGKQVNLLLQVQESQTVPSATEETYESQKRVLTTGLREELSKIHEEIVIDTIQITRAEDEWKVNAELTIDPSNPLTEKDREAIEISLTSRIHAAVSLSLDMVPRIKLSSDEDEKQNTLRKVISTILEFRYPQADLLALSLGSEATSSGSPSAVLALQIRMPADRYDPQDMADIFRASISGMVPKGFIIRLRAIPVEDYEFFQ